MLTALIRVRYVDFPYGAPHGIEIPERSTLMCIQDMPPIIEGGMRYLRVWLELTEEKAKVRLILVPVENHGDFAIPDGQMRWYHGAVERDRNPNDVVHLYIVRPFDTGIVIPSDDDLRKLDGASPKLLQGARGES